MAHQSRENRGKHDTSYPLVRTSGRGYDTDSGVSSYAVHAYFTGRWYATLNRSASITTSAVSTGQPPAKYVRETTSTQ